MEMTKQKLERRLAVDVMAADAHHWPTLHTLNETIRAKNLIPDTVLNHNEYYERLQHLAFLSE